MAGVDIYVSEPQLEGQEACEDLKAIILVTGDCFATALLLLRTVCSVVEHCIKQTVCDKALQLQD